MTRVALLYLYESWRTPRALRGGDQQLGVKFLAGKHKIAVMSWRAPT